MTTRIIKKEHHKVSCEGDRMVIVAPGGGRRDEVPLPEVTAVVAYKKDLFRPLLINLLFTVKSGEVEVEEISHETALLISTILERQGLPVAAFDSWWEQVTDPLHRQGDITVL